MVFRILKIQKIKKKMNKKKGVEISVFSDLKNSNQAVLQKLEQKKLLKYACKIKIIKSKNKVSMPIFENINIYKL